MIVGEISGDALGASLIQALQRHHPDLIVEGIVGPQLIENGARELFPMAKINVMGLFEPLKRLPELYKIRKTLLQHFIQNPPDVFIGIDAPDFNLGIEQALRKAGIKTVHYVSPTIWAWRAGRIKAIKKSVDLMLTIFPFENKIYEQHKIPVCFVGHPFADEIPLHIDSQAAKRTLGFHENDTVIAILPGSRDKELYYLAEDYLKIAQWCLQQQSNLKFVMPLVSEKHQKIIEKLILNINPKLPIHIILNNTRLAIAAADVALVTSGTATLEVMLHKKPMVVGYRMNPITYQIAKRLVKLPYIAMANILAEEKLAPEFIQSEVITENMGATLLELLKPSENRQLIIQKYVDLHQKMRKNASDMAANAILKLL